MNLVFVDSGAFYALADRRDPAHARAKDFYAQSESTLLTTDFIFAETMSLLTKRLGKKIAVTFGQGIRNSSRIHLEETAPDVREAGWKLFAERTDEDYDLIDCISFAVMEASGIREVFGFDRHFKQHGFALVPDGRESDDLDALVTRMQQPAFHEAMNGAFEAAPRNLGAAHRRIAKRPGR